MIRRPMIAGNWKLNGTVTESLALVRELRNRLDKVRDCDIVIAPPYTALHPVAARLEGSNIALAAQDIYWEGSGAYTGAVSGSLLKEVGCAYVLVGHSERRQLFGETLESSSRRMKAALASGLVPILCVGETLAERQAGRTDEVVAAQLDAGLMDLSHAQLAKVVVAYEPVWAIGTGQVATPAQAQQVHDMIRERVRARDVDIAKTMRILYGGSVKPENAAELLSQPDIDGALVGGASLKVESFAGIVEARPR
ncbi:MAG: triose-phosphate isomerase [Myxococcota bacterium]